MRMKILACAGILLATMIGAAGGAQASTAFTTNNLNVRSGPGTEFGVIGTLAAGTRVQLDFCREGWCKIEQGHLLGRASALHLEKQHVYVPPPAPPPVITIPLFPHKPWPHHPRPPHHWEKPPHNQWQRPPHHQLPWPPHNQVKPPHQWEKPPHHQRPPHHKPTCRIAPGQPCP